MIEVRSRKASNYPNAKICCDPPLIRESKGAQDLVKRLTQNRISRITSFVNDPALNTLVQRDAKLNGLTGYTLDDDIARGWERSLR